MTAIESAREPAVGRAPGARSFLLRQWIGYIASRLLGVVWVVLALIALTFLIVHLVPGDPARIILGMQASDEQVQLVREQLRLNDPLLTQAVDYVVALAHGDLGQSYRTGRPVSTLVAERLVLTTTVAVGALVVVAVIGFGIGLPMGMAQRGGKARRRGTLFTVGTSLIGSIPEYISATVLIVVFALGLRLLPVQGGGSFEAYLLPWLAVGIGPGVLMARIVRNETLKVLEHEYIAAARAKRLSASRLMLTHVLPNVVTSTLTLGGLLLVALLGGTVIAENVFNIAGLGTGITSAIQSSDYPVIQGIILVLGIIAALVNLAIDIILGVLDPRVLQKGGIR